MHDDDQVIETVTIKTEQQPEEEELEDLGEVQVKEEVVDGNGDGAVYECVEHKPLSPPLTPDATTTNADTTTATATTTVAIATTTTTVATTTTTDANTVRSPSCRRNESASALCSLATSTRHLTRTKHKYTPFMLVIVLLVVLVVVEVVVLVLVVVVVVDLVHKYTPFMLVTHR